MKKIFISLSVFVAIVGFGGPTLIANAQAVSPDQTAQLQQTINTLEAKLMQLQAQANGQTVAAPAPMISASDAAAVNTALTALTQALSGLQTAIAVNPQMAIANASGISLALQGMSKTLALIGTTLAGGNAVASTRTVAVNSGPTGPVAVSAPSSPAAPASPSVAQPLVSANSNGASVVTTPTVATPETAQASSAWSFASIEWPYVIVGLLVLAVIALWLFWPSEDEGNKKAKKNVGGIPAKPVTVVPSQPTPLATAVSAPAAPRDQQRKPA